MKKTLSLLLALLMVIAAVPVLGLGIVAEESPTPTTTYAVYDQDFESVDPAASKNDVLQALGWYVPSSKVDEDIADYSVVTIGEGQNANRVLRISTLAPVGVESESFVTVFGGDTMAQLRSGRFTLSYQLTYRNGTTNYNGYSSVIYNYNGKSGTLAGNGIEPATYGIAALRVCGTGFNNVYYPVTSASVYASIEDMPNTSEMSMGNRYNATGAYPSLYARLFLDDPANEAADTMLADSDLFVDKPLNVRMEYNYATGVVLYVNDVLVSALTTDLKSQYGNAGTWNDFVTRTTGSSIALLTTYGVVADIDNISITSTEIGPDSLNREVPELLITEVAPSGDGKIAGHWNEYIEIYNPTDRYIDLRDYALIYTDNMFDGDASDSLSFGNRVQKYTNYISFADLIGKSLVSTTSYYATADYLREIGPERYQFVDAGTTLETGKRYRKDGSAWVEDAVNGNSIKIKYVETWNAKYKAENNYDDHGNVRNDLYNENTLLRPGACVLIFTILQSNEDCWKCGVNAGENDTVKISTDVSFRQSHKDRGLSRDTSVKVIASSLFNLADNCNRRYYIGKAADENGDPINYKNYSSTDLTYITSYADYNTTLIAGTLTGGTDVTDTDTLGKVGVTEGGYSGVYVYGVDASTDYRAGTLYVGRNKVTSSNHIGFLAGYQQIAMDSLVKKVKPELSITEIVPRTLNLKGEDMSAFSAMEITNTSTANVNLYDYTVVRNELGTACSYGKYFTRVAELRPGNPVNKGEKNGAYYYFIEEHISNPETCILAPGETAVLWFLGEGSYTAYRGDDDFGTDYFRQYWVNMGNAQMAAKNANGEYATKVIAVDGNSSETYNFDFAKSVLDLSPTGSAMYGIARKSETVLAGTITAADMVSTAFFAQIATYYNLYEARTEHEGDTYVYQVLDYKTVPANGSMHYIAGRAGTGSVSGMARSMKVQYWKYANNKVYSYKQSGGIKEFHTQIRTNYALQAPDMGSVRGLETLALTDNLYYPVKDNAGNTTYYYYDAARTGIKTLQGAALNTVGTTAKLRFDNAVPASVYDTLVTTYGAENVKVGMLIAEASRVPGDTFNKNTLAGTQYYDVTGKAIIRTADQAIVASEIEVAPAQYSTVYKAIGYIEVKLADGSTKTVWSSVSTTGCVRDVAQKALADTSQTLDENYKYMDGELFYRYSPAERAVLSRFCA